MSDSDSADISKAGSIKYLSLKNFMTYHEASLAPGAGFNVVLGPNGSGKSSLVTAITIGLGGDLSTLRRQKSLADLVNKEADDGDKAEVRIQLNREDGDRFYDILCTINKAGISAYYLDGKRVDRSAITKLVEKLQIQTYNLCQFLPQDVVREFPEMKADKVFHNTLRAVGNIKMLKLHDGLKSKQDDLQNKEALVKAKDNTFNETRARFEEMKKLRQDVKRRKEMEESIKLMEAQEKQLEIKSITKKYKMCGVRLKEAEVSRSQAEKEKTTLKRAVDVFDREKQAIIKRKKVLRKSISEATDTMKEPLAAVLEDEVNQLTKDIEEYDAKLKQSKAIIEEKRNEIVIEKARLQAIDEDQLKAEYHRKCEKHSQVEMEVNSLKSELEDAENRLTLTRHKLQHSRNKLEEKSSEDSKRLNVLRMRNQDAYNGVMWLRQNKDKFKKPDGVHEPIMMLIRLRDPSYAIHLENIIGSLELEAFVCEDQDDSNLLMNVLRKELQYHKINVVHSTGEGRAEFPRPPWTKNLGAAKKVFLDEVLEKCPLSVLKHLCSKKKLNHIAVFERDPQCDNIQKYFVGKTKFEIFGSKYTSAKTKSVDSLDGDDVRYLTMNAADDEQVQEIQREVGTYENAFQACQREVGRIRSLLSSKQGEIKTLDKEIAQINVALSDAKQLLRHINQLEQLVEFLANGQNQDDGRERFVSKREEKIKMLAEPNRKLFDVVKQTSINTINAELDEMKLAQLEAKFLEDRNKYQQAVAKYENCKDEEETHRGSHAQLKDLFKQKYIALPWVKDKTKLDNIQMPEKMRQAVEDQCPKTIPEVRARLETLRTELVSFREVSDHELRVVEELEEKKARQEKELAALRLSITRLERELRRDEDRLVNGIQELVKRINRRFGDLMEKMGFAGEIVLHQGDKELDFKHYGIKILVKFRGKDSLQPLSGSVQSGGEKAVTTALYIMALQEMTQVPFRCVDEINQGMDERNEKLVWQLLVDTAQKHSAQFFYLAPKFPRQLTFDDNMHIHVCFNGSMRRRDRERILDVDDVVETLRRKAKSRKKS